MIKKILFFLILFTLFSQKSFSLPKEKIIREGQQKRYRSQIKQGRPVFGVELKIVDDQHETLPNDGKAFGELLVRGPWITSGYFKNDESEAHNNDGWFATGDVCTIDPEGYMEITDRAKDVIKSGGEWISSIDLENQAMGHPDVMQAAVIGVPDNLREEEVFACIVVMPDVNSDETTAKTLFDWCMERLAYYKAPGYVLFRESLPTTGTQKVQKALIFEPDTDPTSESGCVDLRSVKRRRN